MFPELQIPLIQAPMGGGGSSPEMAAAVSNAGALGSLAGGYLTPAQIADGAARVRALTSRPFALNLFADRPQLPPPEELVRANERLRVYRDALGIAQPATPAVPAVDRDAQYRAVLDVRPAVFSFTFGIPNAEVLAACRARGIVTLGTATTVAEALALKDAGVDAICAQGAEAGAHRGTFLGDPGAALVGTIALVPLIVDATGLPVVAAGGIGDGRGLAAVLALGAVAAQVGTAFLLAPEASISVAYRAALTSAAETETTVTTAFSGRAARALRNRFIDEMRGADAIAPYPYQNTLTGDIRSAAAQQSEPALLSLYAGQAVPLARALPSDEIVRAFRSAAEAALARARDHLT